VIPVDAVAPVGGASGAPSFDRSGVRSFGDVLADALDGTASAVARADGLADAVALGSGDVVAASVARAKADVLLEVVSVAASRVGGAINALLQTQV
jgi:flagellar hook-basal body complex protein FliE